MVKRSKNKVRKSKASISRPKNPTFGAVSTINTAPVAIGNSMRGSAPRVIHTADGCRIIGRDFAYTATSTGTVATWTLVGGMPLTPACLVSSIIKNTALMYNKFKFNKVRFHYITSSPTTSSGDVMFYTRKNEGSANPNCTSATFLPYVLSDSNTVIGPQWTNHTFEFRGNSSWLETDYGATSETERYNDHDVFLYSKTSTTDSPGYVLIDYDISFKEVATVPRAGVLANYAGALAQWTAVGAGFTGDKTINTTVLTISTWESVYGNAVVDFGSTTTTGDIFECILDATNSTFSSPVTAANFARGVVNGASIALSMTDGLVFYAVSSPGAFMIYPSKDMAFTSYNQWKAGVTGAYGSTKLIFFAKKIGSINPETLKYSQ